MGSVFDETIPTLIEFPARISRRRAVVFCCTFLIACAASLTYVYRQPPEYRAVARLQISPAGSVAEATDGKSSPGLEKDANSFLTEVQVLTSRPLLEKAVERLKTTQKLPDLGEDPVGAVQKMLQTEPLKDTQVVQLAAEDGHQTLVSDIVNAVAEVYGQEVADAYKARTARTYSDVSAEAETLRKQVESKRRELDVFRERYDIVSVERNENSVLAKIQGLNQAYTESSQQMAKAQGALQAMRASVAAGRMVVRAKDDPTLANLEQRLSTLREQRQDLERRYTLEYLSRDLDAVALQARIVNLQEQLRDQQAASQEAAITEAEDTLSTAQATVNRLRRDLDENQTSAREFAARLAQFKLMQDDVDHIQAMQLAALDRSTRLQSSERERAPRVELVEAAAPSLAPWRPNYTQDAFIAVAGSLLFALLATIFADFISGPTPASATVVHHAVALPQVSRFSSAPALQTLEVQEPARLPPPRPLARELDEVEIAALIADPSEDLPLIVTALLMGLSPEELVAMRWEQIDFRSGLVHLPGQSARTIRLEEPLAGLLLERHPPASASLAAILQDERHQSMTLDGLNRAILYGAYDAGLDRPQEITAAALRHTYLAFLIRQGIRTADIGRIAGEVPQDEMVAYMDLTTRPARQPLERIQRVHPSLRIMPKGTIN
jgi:uncharacterized protein involved in exopolysaccharide biosynthesis